MNSRRMFWLALLGGFCVSFFCWAGNNEKITSLISSVGQADFSGRLDQFLRTETPEEVAELFGAVLEEARLRGGGAEFLGRFSLRVEHERPSRSPWSFDRPLNRYARAESAQSVFVDNPLWLKMLQQNEKNLLSFFDRHQLFHLKFQSHPRGEGAERIYRGSITILPEKDNFRMGYSLDDPRMSKLAVRPLFDAEATLSSKDLAKKSEEWLGFLNNRLALKGFFKKGDARDFTVAAEGLRGSDIHRAPQLDRQSVMSLAILNPEHPDAEEVFVTSLFGKEGVDRVGLGGLLFREGTLSPVTIDALTVLIPFPEKGSEEKINTYLAPSRGFETSSEAVRNRAVGILYKGLQSGRFTSADEKEITDVFFELFSKKSPEAESTLDYLLNVTISKNYLETLMDTKMPPGWPERFLEILREDDHWPSQNKIHQIRHGAFVRGKATVPNVSNMISYYLQLNAAHLKKSTIDSLVRDFYSGTVKPEFRKRILEIFETGQIDDPRIWKIVATEGFGPKGSVPKTNLAKRIFSFPGFEPEGVAWLKERFSNPTPEEKHWLKQRMDLSKYDEVPESYKKFHWDFLVPLVWRSTFECGDWGQAKE